jgi:hypothetical protein
VKIVALVALALALVGPAYGLFLTLKQGRVPSRYEILGPTRAARPIGYWSLVTLYAAWIALVVLAITNLAG